MDISNMQELDEKACKNGILSILDHFVAFCSKHHLKYYLGYGSLLGAVRHGGFIPWDDDLDIIMPREDYNKLLKIWDVAGYSVIHKENTKGYWYYFAKISDDSTVLKNEYVYDVEGMGLYVDIFPMDGICADAEQAAHIEKTFNRTLRLLLMSNMKKFWPASGLAKSVVKRICYWGAKLMGPNYWLKKIERIAQNAACKDPADAKQYYYGERVVDLSVFADGKPMLFEGREVCVPQDTEAYLTNLYGNYMELPPEDQRTSGHDYKAYLKP